MENQFIDFEIIHSRYSKYEPYMQLDFESNNIIEEDYYLYLVKKSYMGISLKQPISDGKRDLSEFKAFLNYNNKLYLNITSLILLILSLVTLIIDNIKEGDPPIFHIITIISLYIQIVIQIIIYRYYGELGVIVGIMNKYYNIYSFNSEYFKYNTVVLSFVVIITGFYLSLTNHRDNDKNYYYYLVYCFRYSIFNKCCNCCKERVKRNKERNKKIFLDLLDDIYKLEDEKINCNGEKRVLKDKNEKILKEIVNKSNILNKMKNEENSFGKMNEREEIKFEKQFQQLMKDNESNIKIFENIKNQIKKIEKEINYYKMIEFKQELNDK